MQSMNTTLDILHCIADRLDHKSLLGLSVVNKELNAVSKRLIYQAIRISGPWQFVESEVDMILEKCVEICDLVQCFTFRVVILDHPCMDGDVPERRDPGHEFPSRFCILIAKFCRLKKFEFHVPERSVEYFAAEFASQSLKLPTITSITVGPFCHFLVTHCPGVMNVATSGAEVWLHTKRGWATREHSFALIQTLSGRPIRKFAMYEMWSTALLKAVFGAMPELQDLDMSGGLYHDSLYLQLPILAQFKALSCLRLADPAYLGTGYAAVWCGPGHAYSPSTVNAKDAEAVTSDLVLQTCPSIKQLSFPRICAV